jgi:hypothetical protein
VENEVDARGLLNGACNGIARQHDSWCVKAFHVTAGTALQSEMGWICREGCDSCHCVIALVTLVLHLVPILRFRVAHLLAESSLVLVGLMGLGAVIAVAQCPVDSNVPTSPKSVAVGGNNLLG